MALLDGQIVAGVAGQVRVGECNPSKGGFAQHIAGRRLAVLSVNKSGLRDDEVVPPAVQNNAGNIAPRLKSRGREHLRKLLAHLALEIAK